LDKLARGEIIEKFGANDKGDWIRTTHNGVEGWLYKNCMLTAEAPWLMVARNELGTHEFPGSPNNPRVLEYLNATTNLPASVKSKDETPWCSAFVNWCMQQAGIEGTKNALARSWQQWGEHIDQPYKGCVVVFQREKKFGHVGFYLDETETHIKVLGGNQQNPETKIFEVSEKSYPKTDFLEYRSLGKK
jgi:uncharacterized protein (TIGR02594 family)